jgi:hypothetical protein
MLGAVVQTLAVLSLMALFVTLSMDCRDRAKRERGLQKQSDLESHAIGFAFLGLVAGVALSFLVRGALARDELQVEPGELSYRWRARTLSDYVRWCWGRMVRTWVEDIRRVDGESRSPTNVRDGEFLPFIEREPGKIVYVRRDLIRGFSFDREQRFGPVFVEAAKAPVRHARSGSDGGPLSLAVGRALTISEREWLVDSLSRWWRPDGKGDA